MKRNVVENKNVKNNDLKNNDLNYLFFQIEYEEITLLKITVENYLFFQIKYEEITLLEDLITVENYFIELFIFFKFN